MIAAIRSSEAGQRTVVVYTSDHGEAFREHHQMGHTFSVFDEEVRVPGFVDAPSGTLTEAQRAALESRRDVPVFHDDLTPTVLDVMGLWDLPEIDRFKQKLDGESWLRTRGPTRTVPLTNCSPMWSCAFENWGVMRGSLKVLARTPYDRGWRCFDVLSDPSEKQRLHTPECAALKKEALGIFGRLPR
jgi:arylsulfatase A-like enzyme